MAEYGAPVSRGGCDHVGSMDYGLDSARCSPETGGCGQEWELNRWEKDGEIRARWHVVPAYMRTQPW